MERRVTVTLPDGRQAQAVEVPVDAANEKWSEYTLGDGTVVKAKINLVSIVRVENEYDAQGIPVYQVNAQPALAFVHVPDNLMRKRQ
jgi:hypothetical protein